MHKYRPPCNCQHIQCIHTFLQLLNWVCTILKYLPVNYLKSHINDSAFKQKEYRKLLPVNIDAHRCLMQGNPQLKWCCRLYTELSKSGVESRAAQLSHRAITLGGSLQRIDITTNAVNVRAPKKQQRTCCTGDVRWLLSSFIAHVMTSCICQHSSIDIYSRAVQQAYNTYVASPAVVNRTKPGSARSCSVYDCWTLVGPRIDLVQLLQMSHKSICIFEPATCTNSANKNLIDMARWWPAQ